MFRTDVPAPHAQVANQSKTSPPFAIHTHLQFDPEQLLYMICHPCRALSNWQIAKAALGMTAWMRSRPEALFARTSCGCGVNWKPMQARTCSALSALQVICLPLNNCLQIAIELPRC